MGRVFLIAAGLALGAGAAEAAYFDRVEMGARGVGLARAFGAETEDVSAAHWNPGALGLLARTEFLFSHNRPYLVPGLAANSVIAGTPLLGGGAAASWHRLGVDGVVSESVIGLSYGRLLHHGARRNVLVGGTAKLAVVSFDPEAGNQDFGSESAFTGDVGMLWQEGRTLRFGAVWRHLGEPEFDFVGDQGGTSMPGGLELSSSYRWRPESSIMLGIDNVHGDLVWNYAGEVWFYDVFAVRAGVHNSEFAGGVGLKSGKWEVDVAFETDRVLGNSYFASLHILLPRKEGAP